MSHYELLCLDENPRGVVVRRWDGDEYRPVDGPELSAALATIRSALDGEDR